MVTVPAVTPVTTPEEVTVALAVLPLVQLPPDGVSDNAVVAPGQTVAVPKIGPGAGSGFMVINAVVPALPQLLLTV